MAGVAGRLRLRLRLNQPGLARRSVRSMSEPSDPRLAPMGAVELLNRISYGALNLPDHKRGYWERLGMDIRARGIEGFGPISGSIGPWKASDDDTGPSGAGGPSPPPGPPLGGHMPPRT
jgi:hypothetical protein